MKGLKQERQAADIALFRWAGQFGACVLLAWASRAGHGEWGEDTGRVSQLRRRRASAAGRGGSPTIRVGGWLCGGPIGDQKEGCVSRVAYVHTDIHTYIHTVDM